MIEAMRLQHKSMTEYFLIYTLDMEVTYDALIQKERS